VQRDPKSQSGRVDPQLQAAGFIGLDGERHHRLGTPAPFENTPPID
jgi:hypothetical protein